MVGLVDVLLQHQSKFHADHQRLDFVADGGRAVYEFKILPEKLPYLKKRSFTCVKIRSSPVPPLTPFLHSSSANDESQYCVVRRRQHICEAEVRGKQI